KRLAFGQEAIAGMHGLRARRLAGIDDFVDQQITLRSGRWANWHGLIGHLDMQRVAIGLGIDRNGLDPHPTGGLDDTAGDFAAIGDEDAFEHACSVRLLPDPLSSSVAIPMLPA